MQMYDDETYNNLHNELSSYVSYNYRISYQEAQDYIAEVNVSAYSNMKEKYWDMKALKAYLLKGVHHKILRAKLKSKNYKIYHLDEIEEIEYVNGKTILWSIRDELLENKFLNSDENKIFTMLCEGYNLKEISELMPHTYEAIKKKYQKMIKKLKRISLFD